MAKTCIFYRKLLLELLQLQDMSNIKIICKIENTFFYDAIPQYRFWNKTSHRDGYLKRNDRQQRNYNQISWILIEEQIADSLTNELQSFNILWFISEPRESTE